MNTKKYRENILSPRRRRFHRFWSVARYLMKFRFSIEPNETRESSKQNRTEWINERSNLIMIQNENKPKSLYFALVRSDVRINEKIPNSNMFEYERKYYMIVLIKLCYYVLFGTCAHIQLDKRHTQLKSKILYPPLILQMKRTTGS